MFAALGMDLGADTFELSFRRPPLSERSAQPMLVGMGDPVAGPLLGLFYDAPSTPEQLAGPPDLAPAHSHSCDNFRICMKGELIVGQERYHHGEFRLQQSGRPYGQDGDAPPPRRSASASAICFPNCSTTTTAVSSAWSPTSPPR